MDTDVDKLQPARDRTDESLHLERVSTDQALAENVRLGAQTDALVESARSKADTILDLARDKADDKLDKVHRAEQLIQAVQEERELEDTILHNERRLADLRLQREREVHAEAIQDLLPHERARTDRYLMHERTRADDELAHRDDFLGMVSHDLRNLLGGISLNATILSVKASASEEGARVTAGAKKIHHYVARMDRLISDLVDVVSIDAGKLAIRPQPCDAAALVDEVVATFSQVAADKQISLRAQTSGLAFPAEMDRDRLMQVLENLVSNALKFTPAGGQVRVTVQRDDAQHLFSVADTGIGIPQEMLELIFERFWQVGKSDQRGLGLGLYISRCIVDAHGGRIWADSVVGEKSVFRFAIPLTA